ncbi:hypothetical protein Lbys_2857 [Leadbetterella byssophila DSM 17132]|uniref:Outer membrane protein beta-barrel domain-containing protein n=2 Tax=Leadbetterella TaxID=319458 RepID=E4RRY7_LEAB4|nr:hypothetical protein Lbys_2857 [Leadbetterella byssophila DSM 17132]
MGFSNFAQDFEQKMKAFFFILFIPVYMQAQKPQFSSDILAGHRSTTFLHQAGVKFNSSLTLSHLGLLDVEYKGKPNNIYFIRTMLTYGFTRNFAVQVGVGLKNPGNFSSLLLNYRYFKPSLSISYSAGVTYQSTFNFEQALNVEYTPVLNTALRGYFQVMAIGNLNDKGLQRGLQYSRAGLKKQGLIAGIGVNLDQFNYMQNCISNVGIFIKYTV